MSCRCEGWGAQDVSSYLVEPCGPDCVFLPNLKLRQLMREPVTLWSEAVSEPLPDDMREMLAKLG